MNSLAVEAGSSVAVFGTGSVGLAAVMAARIVGANPIIAVDLKTSRLALARELGATHVIDNSSTVDLARRIAAITDGGVDHVLEITGDVGLYRLALDLLNPGGRLASLTGGSRPERLGGC